MYSPLGKIGIDRGTLKSPFLGEHFFPREKFGKIGRIEQAFA